MKTMNGLVLKSETYLEELFKECWNNEYLNNLDIVDHCREVVQIWDKNKVTHQEMEKFDHEVVDLLILSLFKQMYEYRGEIMFDMCEIQTRLEKFKQKLSERR